MKMSVLRITAEARAKTGSRLIYIVENPVDAHLKFKSSYKILA